MKLTTIMAGLLVIMAPVCFAERMADYAMTNIMYSKQSVPNGYIFSFQVAVRNLGDKTIEAPVAIPLTVNDKTLAVAKHTVQRNIPFSPYATLYYQTDLFVKSSQCNKMKITATVDPKNEFKELKEDNNARKITLRC